MKVLFLVENGASEISLLELRGCDAWAPNELVDAGAAGFAPVTRPGPRWSNYVDRLRHQRGAGAAETVHEAPKGPCRGTHARYVLRANVLVLSAGSEAA